MNESRVCSQIAGVPALGESLQGSRTTARGKCPDLRSRFRVGGGVLEVAQIDVCSWTAVRAFVPVVGRPCLADQAAYGDDGVGEVKEGVDDGGPALVAAVIEPSTAIWSRTRPTIRS